MNKVVKGLKDVGQFVALCLSIWLVLGLLFPSVPHFYGWHSLSDYILPAKIKGLYGIELDKPFVDGTAKREGDHYYVSCTNKGCRSIRVDVVDIKGTAYVTSIHVERDDAGFAEFVDNWTWLDEASACEMIETMLKLKYEREPTFKDGVAYFHDWRSSNFITVERPIIRDLSSSRFQCSGSLKRIVERDVVISAYGKLWHKQQAKEKEIQKSKFQAEIDAL